MNEQIRRHIRRNGRTAARSRYGDIIDQEAITHEGTQVGTIFRHWNPVYCAWTWKATITWIGKVYTFESMTSRNEVDTWTSKKITALTTKPFGEYLRGVIGSSGFTIDQVTAHLGCGQAVIYKWYRSESYPDVAFTRRLARLLDPSGDFQLHDTFTTMIDLEK